MKSKKQVVGVMPEPVSDQDLTRQVANMIEWRDKTAAYWAGVAKQIELLNAEVRARSSSCRSTVAA